MENIPGYEGVTTTPKTVVPPINSGRPSVPPTINPQTVQRRVGLTEEEVREALIEHVSQHCCYGSDPAKNMVIRDITMSSAFHYKLETFGESRETTWAHTPYNGEILDTPMNGIAPGPWDIPLKPKKEFSDSVQTTEVPHTASVGTCNICMGACKQRCPECIDGHKELCQWCNGRGKTQLDHTCNTCQGNGRKRCEICSGNGVIKCNTCKGRGKLKHFIKLTVTWRNHTDDFVVENTNLPDDLICDVTGEIVFSDKNFRVSPVTCFQPNINKASKQLIQKHNQVFSTELILQQRQKVRIIPVTEATYSWKNKIGGFFVYGFEKKVHFPNYPQACCCGCTIL